MEEEIFEAGYQLRMETGKRLNNMTDDEKKKDEAYWETIMKEKYGDLDGEGEEEDSENEVFFGLISRMKASMK